MEQPEHNPGEPEFGDHDEDAPHNPGEQQFGDHDADEREVPLEEDEAVPGDSDTA